MKRSRSQPIRTLAHLAALSTLIVSAAAADTLAVFVQATGSDVATEFRADVLPEIRAWADEADVDLKVLDAAEGAPAAVSLTPLIVHVGARGRSVFQGRYGDLGKLEHFVRTSRVVPADGGTSTRRDVAVLELGRAKVYAPLKITAPSGKMPDGFDTDDFRRRARAAFYAGLHHFTLRDEVEIGPSGRAFYMDLHSHRSEDGRYFLSLDLYSQFHCLDPVFRRFDDPISGPESQLDELFAEAARVLEAETLGQIDSIERGDGFDPVPAAAPVAGWDALDLALPEQGTMDAEVVGNVVLASSWAPASDSTSRIPSVSRAPKDQPKRAGTSYSSSTS